MALQGSGRRARLTSALSRGSSGRRGAGCGSDRPQHHDLRAALRKIINKEINHFVDNWGEEGQFPAQEVFKTLGQAGFLAAEKATDIKTTAVRKGDEYIINGSKMWTMSECQADWMYLLANTSEGPAHQNKSLLCLPMNLPVIHVAKKIDKLGMKLLDAAQIFFEDVRAPSKNLIGEEGTGFTYQMLQFQEERLWGVATVRDYSCDIENHQPAFKHFRDQSWHPRFHYFLKLGRSS